MQLAANTRYAWDTPSISVCFINTVSAQSLSTTADVQPETPEFSLLP